MRVDARGVPIVKHTARLGTKKSTELDTKTYKFNLFNSVTRALNITRGVSLIRAFFILCKAEEGLGDITSFQRNIQLLSLYNSDYHMNVPCNPPKSNPTHPIHPFVSPSSGLLGDMRSTRFITMFMLVSFLSRG